MLGKGGKKSRKLKTKQPTKFHQPLLLKKPYLGYFDFIFKLMVSIIQSTKFVNVLLIFPSNLHFRPRRPGLHLTQKQKIVQDVQRLKFKSLKKKDTNSKQKFVQEFFHLPAALLKDNLWSTDKNAKEEEDAARWKRSCNGFSRCYQILPPFLFLLAFLIILILYFIINNL